MWISPSGSLDSTAFAGSDFGLLRTLHLRWHRAAQLFFATRLDLHHEMPIFRSEPVIHLLRHEPYLSLADFELSPRGPARRITRSPQEFMVQLSRCASLLRGPRFCLPLPIFNLTSLDDDRAITSIDVAFLEESDLISIFCTSGLLCRKGASQCGHSAVSRSWMEDIHRRVAFRPGESVAGVSFEPENHLKGLPALRSPGSAGSDHDRDVTRAHHRADPAA